MICKKKIIVTIATSSLALLMSSISASESSSIKLMQAGGKTSLNSKQCAEKGRSVLTGLGFHNATFNTTLSNWSKVKATDDTPRIVKGSNENTKYTIFCRVFESDIVMFTIVGKQADPENLKEVMNRFNSN